MEIRFHALLSFDARKTAAVNLPLIRWYDIYPSVRPRQTICRPSCTGFPWTPIHHADLLCPTDRLLFAPAFPQDHQERSPAQSRIYRADRAAMNIGRRFQSLLSAAVTKAAHLPAYCLQMCDKARPSYLPVRLRSIYGAPRKPTVSPAIRVSHTSPAKAPPSRIIQPACLAALPVRKTPFPRSGKTILCLSFSGHIKMPPGFPGRHAFYRFFTV